MAYAAACGSTDRKVRATCPVQSPPRPSTMPKRSTAETDAVPATKKRPMDKVVAKVKDAGGAIARKLKPKRTDAAAAAEPAPEKRKREVESTAKGDGAAATAKKPKKAAAAIVDAATPSPASDKPKKASKQPSAAAPSSAVASGSASKLTAGATRLDRAQIAKAVRALLTHIERESASSGQLLNDDAPIQVMLATKQMPKAVGKAKACKPVAIALPHPFVSLDTAQICLITKDPQRTYKDKLAAAGLTAKVIGVSKLKKKYHPYEAKRELCAAHELFLADAAVLPILPPLLGKTFFKKRRLPTAVNLAKQDIRAELQRAACGTLFRHATGTSNSVQVGISSQPAEQLVENVVCAVESAMPRVTGGWSNIMSLSLKTTNSIALPFYSEMPHA